MIVEGCCGFGGQPLCRDRCDPISGMIACSAVWLRAYGSRILCRVSSPFSTVHLPDSRGKIEGVFADWLVMSRILMKGESPVCLLVPRIVEMVERALDRQVISSVSQTRS